MCKWRETGEQRGCEVERKRQREKEKERQREGEKAGVKKTQYIESMS